MPDNLKIILKKALRIFALLLTITVIVFSYPIIILGISEISIGLGLKKVSVPVVGTGSMYPSLFWEKSEGGPEDPLESALQEFRTSPSMYYFTRGLTIAGRSFLKREIKHGDMVAFKNQTTKDILIKEEKDSEVGFIKRVIAIAGDTIEIRDGFVIRNSEIIEEPYIFKPRSTYGGSSANDCQLITIPDGHIFVLGDNRKASTDSRFELGLVNLEDVNFILPYAEQENYRELWRDTSNDKALANQPTLDSKQFYELLNEKRYEVQSQLLTPNEQLTTSSKLRAERILETNDFSLEATKSGYTMKRALSEAGYSNILTGEVISSGYYTADELVQNLLYFPDTAAHILDSKYQEIGLSVVNQDVNNCPTQVIVAHFAGYIPPNYDQGVIDSWTQLTSNLEKVIPTWESLINHSAVNQDELSELLELLEKRLDIARDLSTTMQANQWLSDQQKQNIKEDDQLAGQANEIISKLNKQ